MSEKMKLTDEILNRYVDNELSREELDRFNELLEDNEDALTKLRALKLVNSTLHEIEPDKAPPDITLKIMNRLSAVSKPVKQAKSFFHLVMGGFGIAILGMFGYLLSLVEFSEGDGSNITGIVDRVTKSVNESITFMSSMVNSDSIVYFGLMLTAILLMMGYFIFESHKKFKNDLKSLGH